MTKENIATTSNFADEVRDEALESALRDAYDALDPSPEQEERMLAALLDAQEQASGVKEAPEKVNAPQPNRSRGFKALKIALPLAACLVVGVVLVGVAGRTSSSPAPSIDSAVQASANASSDAASSKSERTYQAPTDEEGTSADNMTYEETDGAAVQSLTVESAAEAEGYYDDGDVEIVDGPFDMQDDFNTEEYNAVQERGFISVKSNPLSTVSADVDTASYCNLRRMINDGYALGDIPSGAVRIEEILNYFDYDYAAPAGVDKFSMRAQAAPCPWNEDTQLMVLGFATAEESQAASKGSNLVFLVDVSGSMDSPDKLDLLQDSFATLLESLGRDDRVSIVTYANGEEIVLEGAHGDDDKEIMRAIYKLKADGSTNGEAGLKQAYEVAQRNFIEGGVNRIIMASDGDLNVGMSSESELYDFVDGKRESGIYLSVLGFGSGNYKDNKMETLADHGNGSYHYIDCIEEAERVLKEKLCANLVPFADDVKVQVEFNPAQVKAYRLIGYENRSLASEDFRDDSVDAGDVGPNSQFTVAYEVVLADSKMDIAEPDLKYGNSTAYPNASDDWLTCTMRYHDFDGDEMREQQMEVGSSCIMATPSDDWKLAASIIEFGMLARDSKYAGTASVDSILDLLGTNLSDERDGFKRLVVKVS